MQDPLALRPRGGRGCIVRRGFLPTKNVDESITTRCEFALKSWQRVILKTQTVARAPVLKVWPHA